MVRDRAISPDFRERKAVIERQPMTNRPIVESVAHDDSSRPRPADLSIVDREIICRHESRNQRQTIANGKSIGGSAGVAGRRYPSLPSAVARGKSIANHNKGEIHQRVGGRWKETSGPSVSRRARRNQWKP